MSAVPLRPLSQLSERELEAELDRAGIPIAADLIGPIREWAALNGRATSPASTFPEPEDRGRAVLSELGGVEYVDDLLKPGRIVVVAAEEGTGKSYAISGELGIRVAVAGGSFAGTWPVLQTGPVLVLSEMHPDDDYQREEAILSSLELTRERLSDRYYRLTLASAAGDRPALQVPEWRDYVTGWLRERGALLLILDTATAAAQVDPWGTDIQGVYRGLRGMVEVYPELAIVLVVHLKKPQGRGERRISDVLGEWGRWCDVLLLLEADGLERVKLTIRKRVRKERRVVATKAGGLLVDPQEVAGVGPKVTTDQFVAAVGGEPGKDSAFWAGRFGVTDRTIQRYAIAAGDRIRTDEVKLKGSAKRSIYYPRDGDNADTRRHTLVSPLLSPFAGGGDESTATADSAYIEGAVLSSSSSAPLSTASGLTEDQYQLLLEATGGEEVVQ